MPSGMSWPAKGCRGMRFNAFPFDPQPCISQEKNLTRLSKVSFLVGEEGIEPSIRKEHDFESCAYTSSATRPRLSNLDVKVSLASSRTIHAARIQLFSGCALHETRHSP